LKYNDFRLAVLQRRAREPEVASVAQLPDVVVTRERIKGRAVATLEEEASSMIPSRFTSMHRCPDDYPPAAKRVFRSPEAAILLELRAAKAHTIE
jgi:hypothetical protein